MVVCVHPGAGNVTFSYSHQTRITTTPPSCCWRVSAAVGNFFYYRYADVRLAMRAVWSVVCCSSLRVADRVDSLNRFYQLLCNPQTTAARLHREYQLLPSCIKGLLFDTTPRNIALFSITKDSQLLSTMQRDCHRALLLQKSLLFLTCSRRSSPVQAVLPSSRISVVPGAIPLRRNQIPQEVNERAAEICSLKQRWDERYPDFMTAPPIPDELQDHMAHYMEIPVFDASHPAIVQAFRNQDLNAISNLALRHTIDLQSMRNNRNNRCYTCRHPHRQDSIYIDVPLQQRILNYLRAELAKAPPRVEVEILPLSQQILRLKSLLPKDVDTPDDFLCPVSFDLMSEPMREKGGGRHVFDLQSVTSHIQTESQRTRLVQCPNRCCTWGQDVESLELDVALQQRIATWLKEQVPLS